MKKILDNNSRELISQITAALKETGQVKVTGLGIFSIVQTKERLGHNPKTGEKITIAARKRLKFRASSTLKQAVLL